MAESVIVLVSISSLLQAIGQAVQKQAVAAAVPVGQIPGVVTSTRSAWSALRDRRWLLGMALGIAGAVIGIEALAHGDVLVVVPLFALTIAFSLVIGAVWLRERLALSEWLGLAWLLAGAAALAASDGTRSSRAPGLEASAALWLATSVAVGLVLLLASRTSKKVGLEIGFALSAGAMLALGNVLLKVTLEQTRASHGFVSVTDASALWALAGNPVTALFLLAQGAGVALLQSAYAVGRLSFLAPFRSVTTIGLTAIFAATILREDLGTVRLLAIAAISVGMVWIVAKQASPERPVPLEPREVNHEEGGERRTGSDREHADGAAVEIVGCSRNRVVCEARRLQPDGEREGSHRPVRPPARRVGGLGR